MSEQERDSDIAVEEELDIKEPSQYDVIAHNNDFTSYDEVVMIISQAFQKTEAEAFALAQDIDQKGKGVCGTFSKEVAEMKLILVDSIKETLVNMFPGRAQPIRLLKFTMEKA